MFIKCIYFFINVIITYNIILLLNSNLNNCFTFSNYCVKNRIKSYLVKYSIITTTVIHDTLNFHLNFILKYNIHNHYYIALDKQSFHIMKNHTSNIFLNLIKINLSKNVDFGSKNYGEIVMCKTKIGNSLLSMNREVLLFDIDIYFFNNPLQFMINRKEDLIITLDGYKEVNTGF